jgi:hypothetical protein
MFASEMCAGQAQLVAQKVRERRPGGDCFGECVPVDNKRNAALIHIVSLPCQCL